MGTDLTDRPQPETREPVRLAAVGDLLLVTDPAGIRPPRDTAALLGPVRPLLAGRDVVLGNLECTLPGCGETVPTEPRVIATPDAIRGIRTAGFNVVCLANNHTFDCLADGYHEVRELLRDLGIAGFGAGDDLAGAAAPAILEVRGTRLAFLGAVDEQSGATQFAGPGRWGIAPLDMTRMVAQVRELRRQVDHVIVSVHWGEERFLIPSPTQVEQAHALADAGAAMVLGHHAHVVQGLEVYHGVPILYSLGNFVASEVPFTDGGRVTWNRTGRTGCVLTADLSPDGAVNIAQTATYDTGLEVEPDRTGFGERRFARVNRAVAGGVSLARYRREHFWVKTVKPVLGFLRWSRLKTLRLRHVGRVLAGLVHAGRAR